MTRSRARSWCYRAAILGVSAVAALIACELLVRLVAPQEKSWLEIYRQHPQLGFHALLAEARQVIDTGETHYTVVTDEHGFRRPLDPIRSGPIGVLWLGDSFGFGHGVEFEESFIGRLAARGAGRTRHWNASVPAYGPVEHSQAFEHFEPMLQPQHLVVVLFAGNDFHDCIWRENTRVIDGILGNPGGLAGLIRSHSHLYRLVASGAHRLGLGSRERFGEIQSRLRTPSEWSAPFLSEAVETTGSALSAIAALAASRGVEVKAVVIPTRQAVESERAEKVYDGDAMLPVRKLCELLDEAGISYYDATAALRELPTSEVFFALDGHLTSAGSAVLAEALERRWPCLVGG